MLLRSQNLWLLIVAVAISLPTFSSSVFAQESAGAGTQEGMLDPVEKVIDEIRSAASLGLDPEGLASGPSGMVPPPIQAEKQASQPANPQSDEPVAVDALVPRVASRDVQDPGQWSNSETTNSDPGSLSQHATEFQPADALSNQTTYSMPQLRITSQGPLQANIHHTSQFQFRVTNDGTVKAESVNLAITIDGRGRVISAYPRGSVQQAQVIYFAIGELAAGEHREIGFEFQADQPGKIQIAPRLTCSATTQFSIDATAPTVDIKIEGNDQFVVGQKVEQRVIIRNDSTEIVRNVMVRQACTPSSAFENAGFDNNSNIIETLAPGQTYEIKLAATAIQPGTSSIRIVAEGDNVQGEFEKSLLVMQSQLTAGIQGPELTYLNSMGTYAISVTNDQTRAVEDIKVRMSMPYGMVIKVIDRKAEFDAATASITWAIPRLEAGQTETIPFKATVSQTGQHTIKATVSNVAGAITHAQMTTHAVGRADIDLKVITNPEPIEIGATTSIIIQVQNRGTHPAADVLVQLNLPDTVLGIESADYAMQGQMITFDAFELGPGQTHNLTVPVRSDLSGDHIIRATVKSSASSNQIGAENSLFFFNSRLKRAANLQKNDQR